MAAVERKDKTSSMDSTFPVLLPEEPLLHSASQEFENVILKPFPATDAVFISQFTRDATIQDAPHSHSDVATDKPIEATSTTGNAFADALGRATEVPAGKTPDAAELAARNRTLTENNGVAFASTESQLVELFRHLEGDWTEKLGETLTPLLEAAWVEDPLATLKIIWNTRSIHLGKSEKDMFYVALGWLGKHHPRTLLTNLQWLFRPVIQKDKKQRADDDKTIVEKVGDGVDDYDVPDGVSHGYWKDLLSILVLSSNSKLDMSNTRDVLLKRNVQVDHELRFPQDAKKQKLYRNMDIKERREFRKEHAHDDRVADAELYNDLQKKAAKSRKHEEEARRHALILALFAENDFHRVLHYTVARLFAEQLSKDMLVLKSTEQGQQVRISLCAKWAPSLEGFHDKQTLIATTIAEILFPQDRVGEEGDTRELYLKRARRHYRTYVLSPLRKALQVVERDITAGTFSKINYSRVPSLAMDQYKGLFEKKDSERFTKYVLDVADGKRTISGAVLTPGLLVSQLKKASKSSVKQAVVNAQWNTLVQRIKDSGSLSDSIAVCDVSGSMSGPLDRQGVTPIHTAMGLSLIISAVTKAPFGGKIITFSAEPKILEVGGVNDQRTLDQQVSFLDYSEWGMNTDFLKVFTDLILPIAVANKVPKEDMVKRIFVFSDMQFDQARKTWYSSTRTDTWDTHHQIIQKKFETAGYEVPELVYWNLCGGERNRTAPVTADIPGTSLVGGRSQALIKVFLDNGGFDEEDDEGAVAEEDEGFEIVDGANATEPTAEKKKKKKKSMTALSIVKKAIGHKAYDMLKIVD